MVEKSVLSESDVERFHQDGFIGPFKVCSREEMEKYRRYIDTNVLTEDESSPGPSALPANFYRHVDSHVVWDLCSKDAIVDRMRDIYGPDLMLWNSKFWQKFPGAPEVPWHQHFHHVPLEPPVTLTAWIALTDVTVENGAVQILPGSHTEKLPQVDSPDDAWDGFPKMADPDRFEVENPVTMDVNAGEAFIFNERTIHRSFENTTEDDRRLSLSARVTLPSVRFDREYVSGTEENGFTTAIMLSGEDKVGTNVTTSPPTPDE